MVIPKPLVNSYDRNIEPWNKGLRITIDIEYIIEKYLEGYSCRDLGKEFGVSEKTIRNRFKELNFKLRSNTKPSEITRKKISETNKLKGILPPDRTGCTAWNKGTKGLQIPWNKGKQGLQESNKKGKNYEEMYGKELSEKYKKLIRARRKTQIFPQKDTSIEIRMQEALEYLKIKFEAHKYIEDIEHSYQCDFFIPVQKGIKQKTIIECDGDYWHNFPDGREKDRVKTTEMQEVGYRVFRIWEHDIHEMSNQDLKDTIYDSH
jgi:very-short-patch-repair endonuclease